MFDQAKWTPDAASACMRKWTENLHQEAKRQFKQDRTHANLLFCFNKENGLVSVNPIPPGIDHNQLNDAIVNAVNEHHLYGVIFIGETWMYFIKEKDHTSFQLLDGEMNVSDLNAEDKKESLMIRMENSEGDCLVYLDEIIRDENEVTLKEGKMITTAQQNWFVCLA